MMIDVDSVLVDWASGFISHMLRRGHQVDYSARIMWDMRDLFPETDPKVISKEIPLFAMDPHYVGLTLYEGVVKTICQIRTNFPQSVMLAVSKCGTDTFTIDARRHHLRHLPLDGIICLGYHESKEFIFKQFNNGIVVDDNADNLDLASECGHLAVVYTQPWNENYQAKGPSIRIDNWSQFL